MTQRIKLENTTRGRLKILEYSPLTRKYACACACGGKLSVLAGMLLSGHTKSCGCLRRDITGAKNRSHQMTGTNTYRAWSSMKARCYTPTATCYDSYGGRGISVCERWRESFEDFLTDMGEAPKKFALDRKDVNGNYELTNCAWHSKKEMGKNKQNTVRHEGKTLDEWSLITGLSNGCLYQRLKNHGSIEPQPNQQTGQKNPRVIFEGKTPTEWAKELGLTPAAITYRLRKHGTVHI